MKTKVSTLAIMLMIWPASLPAANIELTVTGQKIASISDKIFGVNYIWHKISASDYPVFAEGLQSIGSTQMRYPGGWVAERLNWVQNATPNWKQEPEEPGVSPKDIRTFSTSLNFVLPSVRYTKGQADIDRMNEIYRTILTRYGKGINAVEIGNEWWLQDGARRDAVRRQQVMERYAQLVDGTARQIKAIDPNLKVFVTMDWRVPEQATAIRNLVSKESWAAVDGISIHPYCGEQGEQHSCFSLDAAALEIKKRSGKSLIYASEWSATRTVDGKMRGLQAANTISATFEEMAVGGIQYASYWPTAAAAESIALVNLDTGAPTAVGLVFGETRRTFTGTALAIKGYEGASAALRPDGTIGLVVPSLAADPTRFSIDLPPGLSGRIISATVVKARGPLRQNAAVLTELDARLDNGSLSFSLNENDKIGWQVAFIVVK